MRIKHKAVGKSDLEIGNIQCRMHYETLAPDGTYIIFNEFLPLVRIQTIWRVGRVGRERPEGKRIV